MQKKKSIKIKEMIPLTIEENKSHHEQNACYICQKTSTDDKKNQRSLLLHWKCRGAAYNNCNLRYEIPKEIPVVFYNGSKYDYYFTINKLAEEFLGEHTENI